MMKPKPTSVEEYFSWFSPEIQAKLQQIRDTLRAALPEAKEVISYHMPAFKTTEVLVYYAAAKSHLGYYPTNSGVEEFKKELAEYVTSKGAIQFPYDRELWIFVQPLLHVINNRFMYPSFHATRFFF